MSSEIFRNLQKVVDLNPEIGDDFAMKQMTELEIAAKLKAKKPFSVANEADRKKVLTASKFLGVQVITRAIIDGEHHRGFQVSFVQ